jgi:glyoxylase-like metal-dependent hydrolase (beta-lactamase superfamily II)
VEHTVFPVPTSPFPSSQPLAARLIAPVGAAEVRLLSRAGATVLALPNRYSVTYLVMSGDAVVVVDVGSHADVPRILDALRWLGRQPSQVRAVVVSHYHFDHVMGIDALAQRCGCPVAMSRPAFDSLHDGPALRTPPGKAVWPFLLGWARQGFPVLPAADWRVVRRYLDPKAKNPFQSDLVPLDDGQSFFGLPGWKVRLTPGHSDCSMALVHRRAGFLVTGDTVRNYLGGEWNPLRVDPVQMEGTIALLRGLPIRTVFPGHGPVLDGENVLERLKTVRA